MQYSDKILKTPSSFIRNILKVTGETDVISFAGGLPNPISFPTEKLREAINRSIDEHGTKLFQYSTTQGYLPLREYIATKYKTTYGLDIHPDEVLITTGSQQALELIGKVLINKDDGIIMEAPGYLGAIQAFTLTEPTFYSVTLEEDGLNVEELEKQLQIAQSDLEILNENKKNIGNPDSLGKVVGDEIWNQFLNQTAGFVGEENVAIYRVIFTLILKKHNIVDRDIGNAIINKDLSFS